MAELYTVRTISEEYRPAGAGKFDKIWRIAAVTRSGVEFIVEVAEADFNKASVAKLLQERATQIEEILALGQPKGK